MFQGHQPPPKSKKVGQNVDQLSQAWYTYVLLQLKKVEKQGPRVWESRRRSITECKSQRRLDEKASCALNHGGGEGGGDEKGRKRETRSVRCMYTIKWLKEPGDGEGQGLEDVHLYSTTPRNRNRHF